MTQRLSSSTTREPTITTTTTTTTKFILLLSLLLLSGCHGQTNSTTTTTTTASLPRLIVGGENADPLRYPYFTWLTIRTTNGGLFFCGGVLVWPDVVLTAAHCHDELVVRFGMDISSIQASVNRTVDNGSRFRYEHRRTVRRPYQPHPRYHIDTFENDVMTLLLDRPIDESLIQPIRYNRLSSIPTVGTPVRVIGLGALSDGSTVTSDFLQIGNIQVLKHEGCNDEDSYNGEVVNRTMFCAGFEEGGVDACAGDSGSPLVIPGDSVEEDVLVGIVSFGRGCGRPNFPGVYTRLSAFSDYVWGNICAHSSIVPQDEELCANTVSSSPSEAPSRRPTVAAGKVMKSVATNVGGAGGKDRGKHMKNMRMNKKTTTTTTTVRTTSSNSRVGTTQQAKPKGFRGQ